MELERVDVPAEHELVVRNLYALSNLSSEDASECKIEATDVGDVRYSRVESNRRPRCLSRPLSQASISEAQHTVTPSVLLLFPPDRSARHLCNNPALPLPQTNICRPVNERPRVG